MLSADEARLLQKLQRLEALFFGAYAEGERAAAANAIDAIRERLDRLKQSDPPIEYSFTLQDRWSRKLMLALLRRYGIEPFRYRRQRHTTVMARVSKTFVDQTLWPEFIQLSKTLDEYLDHVTERIIRESIGGDTSEAAARADEGSAAPRLEM